MNTFPIKLVDTTSGKNRLYSCHTKDGACSICNYNVLERYEKETVCVYSMVKLPDYEPVLYFKWGVVPLDANTGVFVCSRECLDILLLSANV